MGHTTARQCDLSDPACRTKLENHETDGNLSPTGFCFSACPFLLAGGVRRIAGTTAWIGVHQITTLWDRFRIHYQIRYRIVNGRKEIISREETGRSPIGQMKTTEIAPHRKAEILAYFKKMGVAPSLFDLMLGTLATSIHRLTTEEIWAVGILTETSTAVRLVLEERESRWRWNPLQPYGPFNLRGANAPPAPAVLANAAAPHFLFCGSTGFRNCTAKR